MKEIKIRLKIFKASIINTFRNETAYWSDNWSSLFSTVFYTVGYIIFIKVIFHNTNNIAGYSYDEAMLFYLISQFAAFSYYIFIGPNIESLVESINTGSLDLI